MATNCQKLEEQTARIQAIFNQMLDSSRDALRIGDVNINRFALDPRQDPRRGLSLCVYPSQLTKNNVVEKVINVLRQLLPGQYYYPRGDLHTCLLDFIPIPGSEDLDAYEAPSFANEGRYLELTRECIRQVFSDGKPIEIEWRGVTATRSAIVVQGFPLNTKLNDFRDALREAQRKEDIYIPERIPLLVAHITVARFAQPVSDPSAWDMLVRFLDDNRKLPLGRDFITDLFCSRDCMLMVRELLQPVEQFSLSPHPSRVLEWDLDTPRQNSRIQLVRDDLSGILFPSLPTGYSFQDWSLENDQLEQQLAFAQVQREADPINYNIPNDWFEREFGSGSPMEIQKRLFFVVKRGSSEGETTIVGAGAAWQEPSWRGQTWGRLHWVAVKKQYQGLGLCKPLVGECLRRLAREHDRAYLITHLHRSVAIKVYLDFGFLPDLFDEESRDRWIQAAKNIEHPTLRALHLV